MKLKKSKLERFNELLLGARANDSEFQLVARMVVFCALYLCVVFLACDLFWVPSHFLWASIIGFLPILGASHLAERLDRPPQRKQ